MVVQRKTYLDKLISKKHNGLIKVVTGVRRCGKSYLLFNLFKEYLLSEGVDKNHIIEIAFDAFENKRLQDPFIFVFHIDSRTANLAFLTTNAKSVVHSRFAKSIFVLNNADCIIVAH